MIYPSKYIETENFIQTKYKKRPIGSINQDSFVSEIQSHTFVI